MKTLKKVLAAGVGATVVPALVAAPAMATAFSVQAGPLTGGTGYATANGNVNFASAKKFNYSVNLQDQCQVGAPGDGIGASFQFLILQVSGSQYTTGIKGTDRTGCSDNSPGPFVDSVTWPANIKRVAVIVSMDDNGNIVAQNVSAYIGNPYT